MEPICVLIFNVKMKTKINKDAKKCLRRAYSNLAHSINAVADLETVFRKQKDKRLVITNRVIEIIMAAQGVLNPLAEDEDIRIA